MPGGQNATGVYCFGFLLTCIKKPSIITNKYNNVFKLQVDDKGEMKLIDNPNKDLVKLEDDKLIIKDPKNEKDIYLDLEKQKSELINLIHSGDIETIHSQEPCLEDIFINLTGEKINDK